MEKESLGEGRPNDFSSSNYNRGDKMVKKGEVGTLCMFCGIFFDSPEEVEKHHFTCHYEYWLAQTGKEYIKSLHWWMHLEESGK